MHGHPNTCTNALTHAPRHKHGHADTYLLIIFSMSSSEAPSLSAGSLMVRPGSSPPPLPGWFGLTGGEDDDTPISNESSLG